ncbi:unnamed protein product [Symbiodinium necroappetens]|uniref:Uncharacterized protein n=1 Tax=Symbiodinium necroappetens TaxID=1628268 RepID=A0A812T732_9DINO|nr:unnamed protein product [Symbiodinium necroappetens]
MREVSQYRQEVTPRRPAGPAVRQVAGAPFGPVPTLHFSSGTATCSARGTSRILIAEP